MFLGSNSVRHLNAAVFSNWPYLAYLTLENIIVDDVAACLELIGKQLKGLKIQCGGFDIMDVAVNCPNLVSLIIQKECPFLNISTKARHERLTNKILFPSLKHLEITCSFPKSCFGLIISHAPFLKSIKIFEMPGREDVTNALGDIAERDLAKELRKFYANKNVVVLQGGVFRFFRNIVTKYYHIVLSSVPQT